MRTIAIFILLFCLVTNLYSSELLGQRRSAALVCKQPAFAALKPMPQLDYPCEAEANDSDEKILKRPERIEAIKTLIDELSSFTDEAWWTTSTRDLSVCDFAQKPGMLSSDQRHSFADGEYVVWLFGNERIRLVLIPDPCYQTGYGGSNAFLLYRRGGEVAITQALDGYFSRADNSVNIAFAKLNAEDIIEVATGSGGLTPSLTNYYFAIDPRLNRIVPRNLFKSGNGTSNQITSAMVMSVARSAPLQVLRRNSLAPSFIVYADDENGKIDDNGRTLSRKMLRFDGKIYR